MIDTHQDGTTTATATATAAASASAKDSADRAEATAIAPSVADATEIDQKEGTTQPAGGTDTATKNGHTAAAAAAVETPAAASKSVAAAGSSGSGGNLAAGAGRLVTDEDKGVGDVQREVYAAWLRAAGGLTVGLMLLGCYFGAEGGWVCI